MASLMTETAKAVFIYGIALAEAGDDSYDALDFLSEDERDNFLDSVDYREGAGGKQGFFELGDANGPSLVAGICVKVVDLHENSHHFVVPEAHKDTLDQKYSNWMEKQKGMRAQVLKKLGGKKKPRLLCVLDLQN